MACPFCGSENFFVKNPDDEYEIYEFRIIGGMPVFQLPVEESDAPDIQEDTEAYCEKCAWHGPVREVR